MIRIQRLIFLLFILCVSCASKPAGIDMLRELCEKDYGVTVYERVEASGYYDATTGAGPHYVDDIIDIGFEFVEYCYDKPERNSPVQQPGCWQVYRAKQGSKECSADLNKSINKWVVEPYISWRKDYCFAVKPVYKPEAKIALYNEFISEYLYGDNYKISRSKHWIKKTINKKDLLASIDYGLSSKGKYAYYGYGCLSPVITGKDLKLYMPNYYRDLFEKIVIF